MNDERKHVAFFISGLSGGGVPRVVLNLTRGFAERGYAVDLIAARPEGPLRPQLDPRVKLVPLESRLTRLPWVSRKRSRQVVVGLPTLVRYLRRESPDGLVSADHWVNFTAIVAGALSRVPTRVVVSQHMHLSRHLAKKPLMRRLARWLYPLADAVAAVSNGVADDLASAARLPRESITTIYNPVVTPDFEERARAPLDHAWFAPGSPPVLLGIGRMTAQKDFATLVRAFAGVRRAHPARLMILGDGAGREGLLELAGRLGVAGEVCLPGFVADPLPYLSRAAVFVLSSAWEGLPTVLVEALACGCPVVSTDCPSGPAEILELGAHGRLLPVGDDEEMARAILLAIESPGDPDKRKARSAEFTVGRALDRYEALLFGEDAGAPSTPGRPSQSNERANTADRFM